MKVIGLCTNKGGVAKTSSTIEIASILSSIKNPKTNKNYRVLVIDTDQQGNTSDYVGAKTTGNTLYEVLHAECSVREAIQKIDKFDIIASSIGLSKSDRQFVDHDDVYLLSDVIEQIKDDYDFVICDSAPSKSILLNMIYVAADYIIAPAEADAGSYKGVIGVYQDIKALRESRAKLSHARLLGILLSKYEEKTIMFQTSLENYQEAADKMEDKPFVLPIRKSIVMSECKGFHQSLQEYEADAKPAQDYRAFVDRMLKEMED